MDSETKLNTGRINQKHRTRNALIKAAAELMRQGRVPSIEEVADAAQVSRATAYRYFPTQEHIIAGTAVLQANLDGEAKLEAAVTSDDPSMRLDQVVKAFHERFSTNEVAYRTLLSLMLQRSTADSEGEDQPQMRASRQLHWLQEAIKSIQPQLGEAGFERLIVALIGSTGLEAYTALRDTCLLDPAEAGEVMRWTAQALLKTALAEADADK